MVVFFFQAEDGIRDIGVTGVQTCALPIWVLPGWGERVPPERDARNEDGGPAGGEPSPVVRGPDCVAARPGRAVRGPAGSSPGPRARRRSPGTGAARRPQVGRASCRERV